MNRYFLLNKPINMVSQFISPDEVGLLGDIDFDFPEGTHAIGRLDNESEGLLLLTTDKKITRLMYPPGKQHTRAYLVMVQNEVSPASLQLLKDGVSIKIKGGEQYIARPVSVEIIPDALALCSFATDQREKYPHSWLLITLTEGKFRQVRKMMMAIHHRCQRLIRLSIGELSVAGLAPGEVKEISRDELFAKAGLGK